MFEVNVGREDLEQKRQDGGDVGDERFEIRFGGIVPGLNELWEEYCILWSFAFFFLRVEVFAEDGALAG